MDFRIVFRDIGVVFNYLSFIFLLPIIVALYYQEYFTIKYFVFTFMFCFSIGTILKKLFSSKESTRLKEGLISVAFLWLAITAFAAIPYMALEKLSFLQAMFETMSAWTTTGFSVLVPEELSKTMLFYRSIQQWFGGVGIVVIALAGMFKTGASLYLAEARSEKLKPNIVNTVKLIWGIYAGYTILGILLLFVAGMAPFDAINHSMTAIATGGLSTHSESIGYYDNFSIELVVIFLMLIGSISFLSHHELFTRNIKKFFKDVFVRSLLVIVTISTLLVLTENNFRTSLFTVVSAISSAGFNLDNLAIWPSFSFLILIVLMIIGGGAGSTSSGIKLNRLVIILKSIKWSLHRIRYPRHIISRKVGDTSYEDSVISEIFKFIALYFLFILFGIFIFLQQGYTLEQSIFQPVSAIGNGGLSVITEYTPLSLGTLIILMWVGRIEIWAAMLLVYYLFGRRKI
ncbi:MAG: TrkH family potassium uptake protein [Candidatus Aenigmarchaeota archaeon]|nr:TrkH family potassium uptake protein [Candidatus Aenigmarchaeota archaeon]